MGDVRVVELFAGVGGFRLGLENASKNYKTVWANQWEPYKQDQYAFDCYTSHFGQGEQHVCQDISVAKSVIPQHDLLVGGFPCQDYSIMKKGAKGIEGKKGVLWWEIKDILFDKRPGYVLLENVDRLLWSPGKPCGRDFTIILKSFYELGYAVEWRIINAAEYGYGQRRRRVFIMAYHESTGFHNHLRGKLKEKGLSALHRQVIVDGIIARAFPLQAHSMKYTDIRLGDIEGKMHYCNTGIMCGGRVYTIETLPKTVKAIPIYDILEKDGVDTKYHLRPEDMPKWKYAKGSKREERYRRNGEKYLFSEGSVRFPEPYDMPSRTMLTSEGEVGRTTHVVKDVSSGKLRLLTPVECERLNGFPDGWTDTGMPERMRYFTMGNALVVPIVTRIGNSLIKIIEAEKTNGDSC